jgi:hypothetical protein
MGAEGREVFEGKPLTSGAIMVQPEPGPVAQARIQLDGGMDLFLIERSRD